MAGKSLTAILSRHLIGLALLYLLNEPVHAQQAPPLTPPNAQPQSPLDQELFRAASGGNTEKLAELIERGADSNATDPNRTSLLHIAAEKGDAKTVELLLKYGASTAATNHEGKTPLHLAIHNDFTGSTNYVEVVRLLLKSGADPNARANHGKTPLHPGASNIPPVKVELLLQAGANPNLQDDQGYSPLHQTGDLRCTKLLVQAGAKIDLINNEGLLPVRMTAIARVKPVYDWLIEKLGGKEPIVKRTVDRTEAEAAMTTRDLVAELFTERQSPAISRHLMARGQEVIPPIIAAVEAGKPLENYSLIFGMLGPEVEPALPWLVEQLPDKRRVFGAVMSIEMIRPGTIEALPDETKQKTVQALYEAILDSNGFDLIQELFRFGQLAAPAILQLLRQPTEHVRNITAQQLQYAAFHDQAIETELWRLCYADEYLAVRQAAITSLGSFAKPPQHARNLLLTFLKNGPPANGGPMECRDWIETANNASFALARFGPDILDELIPLMSPMDSVPRIPVITCLASVGEPIVPRLIELLGNHDHAVAVSAGVALNRIGRPSVPALAEAVKSGNEQVVDHATNALWWIGPWGRDALPALLSVAGSDLRSDAARLGAVRAALKIDAAQVRQSKEVLSTIPVMMRALGNGRFKHQGWAAEAARGLGAAAKDTLPALRKRLELPPAGVDTDGFISDYVRREAESAITAIEADVAAKER